TEEGSEEPGRAEVSRLLRRSPAVCKAAPRSGRSRNLSFCRYGRALPAGYKPAPRGEVNSGAAGRKHEDAAYPPAMIRLSVAIVCRDNVGTIGRTIESVRGLADEVVAVDSGSTDGTIELLEAAGARVLHTDWKG